MNFDFEAISVTHGSAMRLPFVTIVIIGEATIAGLIRFG